MGHAFEMNPRVAPRALKPLIPRALYLISIGPPATVKLTFDDGPNPASTPKILSTLAAHQIAATFFLSGVHAEAYPQLVQRIADEGHSIASHAYTHKNLTTLSTDEIRTEMIRTHQLLSPYMNRERLFRPPFGARDSRVDLVARELGYRTVLWNVNSKDWKDRYQPDGWVGHSLALMRRCRESNVLLHDLPTTAEHLNPFLRMVKQIGDLRFVAC